MRNMTAPFTTLSPSARTAELTKRGTIRISAPPREASLSAAAAAHWLALYSAGLRTWGQSLASLCAAGVSGEDARVLLARTPILAALAHA